jgi:hypothetical protein
MKKNLLFLFAVLCLSLAHFVPRFERLTVEEDLPKFMRNLKIFSPECNLHGVYYRSKCYCYAQYDGRNCETKGELKLFCQEYNFFFH